MTREEAKEYADKMTYRDAVYYALQGKCIPYRKATLIKLYELLDMVEQQEGVFQDSKFFIAMKDFGGINKNDP